MSENEQIQRHKTIHRRDWMGFSYSIFAMVSVLLIVILFLGGGIYLLSSGKTVEGFSTIGTAVASVILALFYRAKNPPAKSESTTTKDEHRPSPHKA